MRNGLKHAPVGDTVDLCSLTHSLDLLALFLPVNMQSGERYWLIRNSWATDWGEDGYVRIAHGSNACGLADQPFFIDF
jgi:hypothetical protein